MITVTVSGRRATASNLESLPTGNVQTIRVHVQIEPTDTAWLNAMPVAIFAAKTPKGSWIVRAGVIDENGNTKIPGEVLSVAEAEIYAGVRGTFADNREITTNIASLGKTCYGAGGEIVDTQIMDGSVSDANEFLAALQAMLEDYRTILDALDMTSDGILMCGAYPAGCVRVTYRLSDLAEDFPPYQIIYVSQTTQFVYKNPDGSFTEIFKRNDIHAHTNKSVLDRIGVDDEGYMTFDGERIRGGGADDDDTLVPLALGTEYASLLLRQDWSDVPVYVTDTVSGYTTDGIPSTNVFSMGLFADHTDDSADFIRVVENTDYLTGRPMLLLRVQRNGTGYTCFPEAFHGITEDYTAGWYDDENNAVSAPSLDGMTFGALEVNLEWYDDLSDLPLKAQLALDALSRMVNVSEAARGSLGVRPDMAQRYVGRLDGNRRYRRIASKDFALTFPTLAETETPSTIRLDLTCTRDVTLTLPRERLMDGGVLPNTRRGFHTLTFTYFPAAGKWSIGSVDHVVPQYWDDIPDEVTPFGDCTWAQIKSIAAHGYKNNLGQWCLRRNNVEEVWFEIGDEKTITLSGGETWVLQIWDFNHDDLADGSGKAPFTIGMKGVTATGYKMNTTATNAGGWEQSYVRRTVIPAILETLPLDLSAVISSVDKTTYPAADTPVVTQDKLWLGSLWEYRGSAYVNGGGHAVHEGEQYAIFNTVSPLALYWVRTTELNSNANFVVMKTNGGWSQAANTNTNLRLAFCI